MINPHLDEKGMRGKIIRIISIIHQGHSEGAMIVYGVSLSVVVSVYLCVCESVCVCVCD